MEQREQSRASIERGEALVVGAIADVDILHWDFRNECDVIELRLDSLGCGAEVLDFAKNSPFPLLITARGQAEGGQSDWSVEERIAAYRALMEHASLIDIELRDFDLFEEVIEEAKSQGVMVVGSFHHFGETPDLKTLNEKIDLRADIHKFALMAKDESDISLQLQLFRKMAEFHLSVMGMGPLGAAARPLMAKTGSLLNYGFLGETPTAPHQWPANLLKATLIF